MNERTYHESSKQDREHQRSNTSCKTSDMWDLSPSQTRQAHLPVEIELDPTVRTRSVDPSWPGLYPYATQQRPQGLSRTSFRRRKGLLSNSSNSWQKKQTRTSSGNAHTAPYSQNRGNQMKGHHWVGAPSMPWQTLTNPSRVVRDPAISTPVSPNFPTLASLAQPTLCSIPEYPGARILRADE